MEKKSLPQIREVAQNFGQKLNELKGHFSQLIPKHLSVEKMFRLGQLAISRQPLLAQCSMSSLLASMLRAAEYGLMPDGIRAALVPFRNKNGLMEATLIIMWQGYAELCRRTGKIESIDTDIVRQKDTFKFVKGLRPELYHAPALQGDRGDIIGAWALVKYKGGGSDMEWMSKADIDAVRARSRASEYGPWVSDYPEMARKTVFRRLAKRLPKTEEMVEVLDAENRFESGAGEDIIPVLDVPVEPAPTATDKLLAATNHVVQDDPGKDDEKQPESQAPTETPVQDNNEPEHQEKVGSDKRRK